MIGQHIDPLDVVQRVEEVAQFLQQGVVVRDTRHEDVADPYRFPNVG